MHKSIDCNIQHIRKICSVANVISNDKLNKFAILEGSQLDSNICKINRLVEKPKIDDVPLNLAIIGIYILTQDIFDNVPHNFLKKDISNKNK